MSFGKNSPDYMDGELPKLVIHGYEKAIWNLAYSKSKLII